MDLVQCTARSVTVVGGGANPSGSPGFRARRLQPLLDERVVAQVRIHPSQRRPLARPCAHTDHLVTFPTRQIPRVGNAHFARAVNASVFNALV